MAEFDIQDADLATLDPLALTGDGCPPAWRSSEPFFARARALVAYGGPVPLARLSYEVAADLSGAPGLTGLIGRYDAVSAEAGVTLLREAAQRLRRAGAEWVLGPMNGSTWGSYRLVVGDGDVGLREPPFLAEPVNPPDYPGHFLAAGFTVVAGFESRILHDLSSPHPRARERAERMASDGVTVRPIDPGRFEEELEALHGLSLAAFADNPWYAPIDLTAFLELYVPLRPLIDPDLVLVARDRSGAMLGFVFAFVDPLGSGRRRRVVAKSMATLPAARGLGLGTVLLDRVREGALEKGHGSVIHALMHADNDSLRISRSAAEVFRRYALFGLQVRA